jgi:ABC-2 type transport system ATP-binding protein
MRGASDKVCSLPERASNITERTLDDNQQANVPSIEVTGLTKNYGPVTALRDVSFSIRKGEVVGFLGPNGAGKSTTLRILCGLMPATSGEARVCGISLARNPGGARRHIGYMPENNPLPEDLRVIEYLRLRARLKDLSGRKMKERVDEVMDLCDLRRKARRKLIGALSKGYRQRVGIADAILARPDVAILDEPTIGLDPHQVVTIRQLIAQLRGQMTIVISSHILPEIELSCDRVIIMNNGRLVAMGTPAELRREFVRERSCMIEIGGEAESFRNALYARRTDLALLSDPAAVADGRTHFTCKVKAGEDISADLLAAASASAASAQLLAFHMREPTLEDVFLAATLRTWDAADEQREGKAK